MIENIGELITRYRTSKKKIPIDTISNSKSVEEAKAKVQAIIDSGALKRKKVHRRRKQRAKKQEKE